MTATCSRIGGALAAKELGRGCRAGRVEEGEQCWGGSGAAGREGTCGDEVDELGGGTGKGRKKKRRWAPRVSGFGMRVVVGCGSWI